MTARAPTEDERAQLQAVLAEVVAPVKSVTSSTPTEYGEEQVDQIAAFLKSDPIFAVADCGPRMCRSFGYGAEDEIRATAGRLMRAMRGDLEACERYAKYLATTRALKGTDLLTASFRKGAYADFWPSAGFLFRPPTHRHLTRGKYPVMIYAPVGVEPSHVLRVPKQQLYACLHYQLELYLETERTRGHSGHVLIFDLAEFGWRHLHRRFLTQVVQLVGVLLKNYPEMIHKIAIVNAPAIFSIVWKAILPFANEHVQSKISIARGPNMEVLLELAGPEGLPTDMGGANDDSVDQAPASAVTADDVAWTDVTIDAGKTHRHVVKVEAPAPVAEGAAEAEHSSLAVEFTVESAEISFMVVYDPPVPEGSKKAPEQEYALEPEIFHSSGGAVSKIVDASRPGTYTFVWDNTQAWRYSRNVAFRFAKVSGSVAGEDDGDDTERLSRLPEWDGLSDAEMTRLTASDK